MIVFAVKIALFFTICITAAAYLSWTERKLIGRIQLRFGPDQCGIYGLIQPIADAVKLLFKQCSLTDYSKLSIVSVCLMFTITLIQLTLIPFYAGEALWNPENSIVIIVFTHGMMVFCETMIGMSSNSKFGVIGGVRSCFQGIASHIPFIVTIVYVILLAQSSDIVSISNANSMQWILTKIPLGMMYFVVMLMMSNKIPFDFPEAESEIVSGTYVEYGGILFGLIYLSDYLNILFQAALFVTLFVTNVATIPLTFITVLIVIIIRAILPRTKQHCMIKLGLITITTLASIVTIAQFL